jgi:hypothetical protein
MSLRLFTWSSPSSPATTTTTHTGETFWELWRAASWLAHHRRFCSVGCVLIEYATKIVLLQLPKHEQEQCFRALTQTTGVDVRDVDSATLVSTALTGSVPSAVPTSTVSTLASLFLPTSSQNIDTAGLIRDVIRDLHSRAATDAHTYGTASHIMQTLGEAAIHSYLRQAMGLRPQHEAAAPAAAAAAK